MTSDVTVDLQDRFALAQKMAIEAGAVALAHFNARERLVIETKARSTRRRFDCRPRS